MGAALNFTTSVKNLLLRNYIEKTSYFEAAPPCHTIADKPLIIY